MERGMIIKRANVDHEKMAVWAIIGNDGNEHGSSW